LMQFPAFQSHYVPLKPPETNVQPTTKTHSQIRGVLRTSKTSPKTAPCKREKFPKSGLSQFLCRWMRFEKHTQETFELL
jgi:hypothetical protein